MKAIPIFILALHFNDAFSLSESKNLMNPKKPILPKKNMKILLSRRILNGKPTPIKTKKPKFDGYTVFPTIPTSIEKKLYHVPSSLYFPSVDPYEPQKTRVKKDLPDYIISAIRRKRSADSSKLKTHKDGKEVKSKTNKEAKENKLKTHKESNKKDNTLNRKEKLTKRRQRVKAKEKTYKELSIIKYHANGSVYTVIARQTLSPNRLKHRSNQTSLKKSHSGKFIKKNLSGSTNTVKAKQALVTGKMKGSKNNSKSIKQTRLNNRGLRDNERGVDSRARSKIKHVPLRAKAGRRLIAARDAMIEDYPYVVSIQKNKEHWCAGALLNPVMVITTANCVWKSNRVSRLRVRVGSRHTDRGGIVVGIQEVMKHPNWSIRKNPDNDVALLLLDERIKFSDRVHGVDLPNRIMMPPFEDAWVTSWGSERVFHARFMNRNDCNNVTQRFGISVTENFICIAQTGRRAPCTRDTGAPAVSDGVLWGLASWGIRKLCGTERFPAMFSYLGSQTNMDFIANATRYMMADERFYPFLDRYPTTVYTTTQSTPVPFPFV